ncbi:MAG: hypothetical protein K2M68_05100 [Muribaculaceae bacterium]|nr:hypothetical protein [Muribaculaceae bacterium]
MAPSIFSLKPQASTNNIVSANSSPDNKIQDETYKNYGIRICGKVTASLNVLNPFLLSVYNGEKQRQISDKELQEQRKNQLSNELVQKNGQISLEKTKKEAISSKIQNLQDDIENLSSELLEAKNKNGQINKMARVKLWIGCIILSILTVYLFIFYSSTFYSAFFKNFLESYLSGDKTGVGKAMFDPQALPNALHNGLGELVFIICAPIIFMGLGYCLHYFLTSKSYTRFFKAGSILLITVMFDCILAYLIGKNLYDIEILTTIDDMPSFSPSLAFVDINFWAVIFCGFIVYLIWGIVFDMTLTAYEDLRSNKYEIGQIKNKIDELKKDIIEENKKLNETNLAIDKLNAEKATLEQSLSQNVFFDLHIIKLALSDFFAGWMTMMNTLSTTNKNQETATNIYNDTVNQLFN